MLSPSRSLNYVMVGYVLLGINGKFHRLYIFRMGNSSRSPEDYELVYGFRQGDWMQQPSEEGVQIWRNRITKQSAVLLRLGGMPGSEDLDIYTTRTMENDLVKVHHLLLDKHSDFCSLYSSAQLLVEYIPIRLSSLRNFDREEALTIFGSALRAFHLLQIKFGPVVPHEDLIGFNEQGKTKVWLNRNSAINCADQKSISEELKATGRRVQLLFELVEQRARYVLLPPVIKEEIYHPLTSHLSALKTLEKFAYYEKLNLRKWLQFGSHKAGPAVRPLRTHARNHSYLTEARPQHEVQWGQNGAKQNQLRRNYSLNNIHNQQTIFRRSIIGNNTSPIESARPTLVFFSHHAPPSPQVSNYYHRQETLPLPPKTDKISTKPQGDLETEHIQTHPETPADKQDKQQIYDVSKKKQDALFDKKEEAQQSQILLNNKQFSIIDKITFQFADQIKIKQFESIDEPIIQAQMQPKSPTFVHNQQIKYELPSFAPSQQNFDEVKGAEVVHNLRGNELNLGLLQDKINSILIRQQQEQARRTQQQDEERRLSIEQKASKLVFSPDFMLNPGSLLNYCTSVQSKLHMATNRQHSIIEQHSDALESKAKQDEKHSKVKRIESKYIAVPQSGIHQNRHRFVKQQPVSKGLGVEQDFLDVNFLQKSLDKRYNNQQHYLKVAQKQRQMQENDALNIAKLQQGLLKFSKSQLSQKNSDVLSKQQIPLGKKSQNIEFNLQRSTGFESYHPFRQKRNNQDTTYDDPYLLQKQLNRMGDRRSSKYRQHHHKPRSPHQKRQIEDNVNQYSFEQNRRNAHFVTETQLSTNDCNPKPKQAGRLIAKPARPRASAEVEEAGRASKGKGGATRKISYQQLVQFLWN